MNNKSIIFYTSYKKYFEFLSREEIGDVISALLEYIDGGKEPQSLSSMANLTYTVIKNQTEIDLEKYEERKRINSENGKKGGRPRKYDILEL